MGHEAEEETRASARAEPFSDHSASDHSADLMHMEVLSESPVYVLLARSLR